MKMFSWCNSGRGWELYDLWGPFQLRQFYDAMILWSAKAVLSYGKDLRCSWCSIPMLELWPSVPQIEATSFALIWSSIISMKILGEREEQNISGSSWSKNPLCACPWSGRTSTTSPDVTLPDSEGINSSSLPSHCSAFQKELAVAFLFLLRFRLHFQTQFKCGHSSVWGTHILRFLSIFFLKAQQQRSASSGPSSHATPGHSSCWIQRRK